MTLNWEEWLRSGSVGCAAIQKDPNSWSNGLSGISWGSARGNEKFWTGGGTTPGSNIHRGLYSWKAGWQKMSWRSQWTPGWIRARNVLLLQRRWNIFWSALDKPLPERFMLCLCILKISHISESVGLILLEIWVAKCVAKTCQGCRKTEVSHLV